MNNSKICSTKINGVEKPKKKYKTAQEAFHAAKTINSLPTTLHVFGEYKCLTCLHFHIGRTSKVTTNKDLFIQPSAQPLPKVVEPVIEKPTVDLFAQINPNLVVFVKDTEPAVEPAVEAPVEIIEAEEPFDWETPSRKPKVIDNYYTEIFNI